jgi:hypothetical protein
MGSPISHRGQCMTPASKRADQAFTRADRTAAAENRDKAFFGRRRATEVANLQCTLELRALRFAWLMRRPIPNPKKLRAGAGSR